MADYFIKSIDDYTKEIKDTLQSTGEPGVTYADHPEDESPGKATDFRILETATVTGTTLYTVYQGSTVYSHHYFRRNAEAAIEALQAKQRLIESQITPRLSFNIEEKFAANSNATYYRLTQGSTVHGVYGTLNKAMEAMRDLEQQQYEADLKEAYKQDELAAVKAQYAKERLEYPEYKYEEDQDTVAAQFKYTKDLEEYHRNAIKAETKLKKWLDPDSLTKRFKDISLWCSYYGIECTRHEGLYTFTFRGKQMTYLPATKMFRHLTGFVQLTRHERCYTLLKKHFKLKLLDSYE